MRIGVICEGPTDYWAIKHFFGQRLNDEGVLAEFVDVQPKMDNTRPEGSWGNVLLWLTSNPPEKRIQDLFGGGLFGGSLAKDPLDALIIQMDTDILGHQSFERFVKEKLNHEAKNPGTPIARADEVRTVLAKAANLQALTQIDIQKHVLTPSVESTEAWCVAAVSRPSSDFEVLSGQQLIDEFMSALERSENNNPAPPYAKINKTINRRKRFCEDNARHADWVMKGCRSFQTAFAELKSLA